MLVYAGGIFL